MDVYICWILVGVLALLGGAEIRRYLLARIDEGPGGSELPYPRRRLSRRLGLSLLFIVSILAATYIPSFDPWIDLAILAGIGCVLALGIWLLWRELRETSASVVRHYREFNREALGEFEETVEKRGRSDPPDPSEH